MVRRHSRDANRFQWWWVVCAIGWLFCVGCTNNATDSGALTLGPTVSCLVGQRACGGVCVDLQANPASCGACGKVCGADQLCDQGACKAKAQGCSAGLLACSGGCIDAATDASHCGRCDQVCGSDKACSAGSCTCLGGKSACLTSCVDLQTDGNNCGACGTICALGQSCLAGSCQCPADRKFCGGACIDTQSDAKNCGNCGVACSADKVCALGQCSCPVGQLLCGNACVDILSNDANCGSCGTRCGLGQACRAGQCGAGGGPRADGCSGLAQNVSLSELAAYQAVEVPLMKEGTEVAQALRVTDVVVGRDATFRVFISVGNGFAPRELSARLFLENAGGIDLYYAKKTISVSSQAASLDSTFQISVPKDKITLDSRYALELVECGTNAAGAMLSPRFPAVDGVALSARQTGALKIKILPLIARNMQADTSDTALQVYKSLFMAMYPIASIDLSVGGTLTVADDSDWSGMLDQVRAKRQSDAPAADVYYYGFLKPTTTLRAYCGNGCTAGIGFVPQGNANQQPSQRAALGLAFADVGSAETMAHEVGHNHGRNHSPCVQGGTISGVDANYPHMGGVTGVYGWDSRTSKLLTPDRTDIMGYCNNRWISEYTYDGILNRVAQVNGAKSVLLDLASLRTFRVLLVDARGARWGIPINEPSPPAGEPEMAEILDASGQVIDTAEVYRTLISDIDAASIQVPKPETSWYAVRVAGAPPVAF